MAYGEQLDKILQAKLQALIKLAEHKQGVFEEDFAKKWYEVFLERRREA